MKLTGNTILLTGGSAGIGLVLAEELIARGNRVLTCGRREARLKEARQKLPALETLACDIGSEGGRRELAAWAVRTAPGLNVLINNAGVQHRIDLSRDDESALRGFEEIDINLTAPIHLCQLLLPQLMKQPAAAIVNISSGLAFTPFAAVPVYSATKAALHSFSLSLRYQLRKTSVRVYETAPPLVESELHDHQTLPPGVTLVGMPTREFVADCLSGLERDIETHPVGPAANMYEKREALLGVMNPA
jgi:uncharacterized oxidoreductase